MSDDTTPRDEIGAQLFQRARVKAYKKPNADLILFGLFTEAAKWLMLEEGVPAAKLIDAIEQLDGWAAYDE
jgi:hypothetical protein